MVVAIGHDLDKTYTSLTDGKGFSLGDRVCSHDGKDFVFVQAGGAIAANDAVAIAEDYQAIALTTAAAEDGHKIGVAPVAFADDEYGWVQVRGVCELNVLGAYAADGILYTTATAGSLDDAAATTLCRIHGLIGTEAGTTGATTVAAFMAIEPFADAPTG
jgi:hypothetical protein